MYGPATMNEDIYPTFNMSLNDLPECDYEVGTTCELELTVKVISKSESQGRSNVTFEVRKVAMDDDDDE